MTHILDSDEYPALLAALRKDLQLDATTDVLPQTVAAAWINDLIPGIATAATAGARVLPATPAGFLLSRDQSGTVRKVPFYNN